MIPPKHFDIFPPDWGMLRMPRCVQIFLKTTLNVRNNSHLNVLPFFLPKVNRYGTTNIQKKCITEKIFISAAIISVFSCLYVPR